ncbi:hypothetical protein PAPYR_8080 [Paratrimastix pyriformis]|uniref:FMP27/BLTP2/Hobbit GFWDK motif-containing RBG unit domain-containing protein n=1 Tax=Paratrimastix pyriformis TaxID=342808 RepID=A0ABQ8UFG2_9EUKA|nr:hypothetical protein PAPYR_8080 [Paratrimastix pyriformis]
MPMGTPEVKFENSFMVPRGVSESASNGRFGRRRADVESAGGLKMFTAGSIRLAAFSTLWLLCIPWKKWVAKTLLLGATITFLIELLLLFLLKRFGKNFKYFFLKAVSFHCVDSLELELEKVSFPDPPVLPAISPLVYSVVRLLLGRFAVLGTDLDVSVGFEGNSDSAAGHLRLPSFSLRPSLVLSASSLPTLRLDPSLGPLEFRLATHHTGDVLLSASRSAVSTAPATEIPPIIAAHATPVVTLPSPIVSKATIPLRDWFAEKSAPWVTCAQGRVAIPLLCLETGSPLFGPLYSRAIAVERGIGLWDAVRSAHLALSSDIELAMSCSGLGSPLEGMVSLTKLAIDLTGQSSAGAMRCLHLTLSHESLCAKIHTPSLPKGLQMAPATINLPASRCDVRADLDMEGAALPQYRHSSFCFFPTRHTTCSLPTFPTFPDPPLPSRLRQPVQVQVDLSLSRLAVQLPAAHALLRYGLAATARLPSFLPPGDAKPPSSGVLLRPAATTPLIVSPPAVRIPAALAAVSIRCGAEWGGVDLAGEMWAGERQINGKVSLGAGQLAFQSSNPSLAAGPATATPAATTPRAPSPHPLMHLLRTPTDLLRVVLQPTTCYVGSTPLLLCPAAHLLVERQGAPTDLDLPLHVRAGIDGEIHAELNDVMLSWASAAAQALREALPSPSVPSTATSSLDGAASTPPGAPPANTNPPAPVSALVLLVTASTAASAEPNATRLRLVVPAVTGHIDFPGESTGAGAGAGRAGGLLVEGNLEVAAGCRVEMDTADLGLPPTQSLVSFGSLSLRADSHAPNATGGSFDHRLRLTAHGVELLWATLVQVRFYESPISATAGTQNARAEGETPKPSHRFAVSVALEEVHGQAFWTATSQLEVTCRQLQLYIPWPLPLAPDPTRPCDPLLRLTDTEGWLNRVHHVASIPMAALYLRANYVYHPTVLACTMGQPTDDEDECPAMREKEAMAAEEQDREREQRTVGHAAAAGTGMGQPQTAACESCIRDKALAVTFTVFRGSSSALFTYLLTALQIYGDAFLASLHEWVPTKEPPGAPEPFEGIAFGSETHEVEGIVAGPGKPGWTPAQWHPIDGRDPKTTRVLPPRHPIDGFAPPAPTDPNPGATAVVEAWGAVVRYPETLHLGKWIDELSYAIKVLLGGAKNLMKGRVASPRSNAPTLTRLHLSDVNGPPPDPKPDYGEAIIPPLLFRLADARLEILEDPFDRHVEALMRAGQAEQVDRLQRGQILEEQMRAPGTASAIPSQTSAGTPAVAGSLGLIPSPSPSPAPSPPLDGDVPEGTMSRTPSPKPGGPLPQTFTFTERSMMRQLLERQNATLWRARVDEMLRTQPPSSVLMSVTVAQASVALCLDERLAPERIMGTMAALDGARLEDIPPTCDTLFGRRMVVDGYHVVARLRDYPLPLGVVPHLRGIAFLIGAEQPCLDAFKSTRPVTLGPLLLDPSAPIPADLEALPARLAPYIARRSYTPIKMFYNVRAVVHDADITFGPAWFPALMVLARCMDRFTPPSDSPWRSLPWWDAMRYFLHGRLAVVCGQQHVVQRPVVPPVCAPPFAALSAHVFCSLALRLRLTILPTTDPRLADNALTLQAARLRFCIGRGGLGGRLVDVTLRHCPLGPQPRACPCRPQADEGAEEDGADSNLLIRVPAVDIALHAHWSCRANQRHGTAHCDFLPFRRAQGSDVLPLGPLRPPGAVAPGDPLPPARHPTSPAEAFLGIPGDTCVDHYFFYKPAATLVASRPSAEGPAVVSQWPIDPRDPLASYRSVGLALRLAVALVQPGGEAPEFGGAVDKANPVQPIRPLPAPAPLAPIAGAPRLSPFARNFPEWCCSHPLAAAPLTCVCAPGYWGGVPDDQTCDEPVVWPAPAQTLRLELNSPALSWLLSVWELFTSPPPEVAPRQLRRPAFIGVGAPPVPQLTKGPDFTGILTALTIEVNCHNLESLVAAPPRLADLAAEGDSPSVALPALAVTTGPAALRMAMIQATHLYDADPEQAGLPARTLNGWHLSSMDCRLDGCDMRIGTLLAPTPAKRDGATATASPANAEGASPLSGPPLTPTGSGVHPEDSTVVASNAILAPGIHPARPFVQSAPCRFSRLAYARATRDCGPPQPTPQRTPARPLPIEGPSPAAAAPLPPRSHRQRTLQNEGKGAETEMDLADATQCLVITDPCLLYTVAVRDALLLWFSELKLASLPASPSLAQRKKSQAVDRLMLFIGNAPRSRSQSVSEGLAGFVPHPLAAAAAAPSNLRVVPTAGLACPSEEPRTVLGQLAGVESAALPNAPAVQQPTDANASVPVPPREDQPLPASVAPLPAAAAEDWLATELSRTKLQTTAAAAATTATTTTAPAPAASVPSEPQPAQSPTGPVTSPLGAAGQPEVNRPGFVFKFVRAQVNVQDPTIPGCLLVAADVAHVCSTDVFYADPVLAGSTPAQAQQGPAGFRLPPMFSRSLARPASCAAGFSMCSLARHFTYVVPSSRAPCCAALEPLRTEIHVTLDGAQAFVAPLDVDKGAGVPWIRFMKGGFFSPILRQICPECPLKIVVQLVSLPHSYTDILLKIPVRFCRCRPDLALPPRRRFATVLSMVRTVVLAPRTEAETIEKNARALDFKRMLLPSERIPNRASLDKIVKTIRHEIDTTAGDLERARQEYAALRRLRTAEADPDPLRPHEEELRGQVDQLVEALHAQQTRLHRIQLGIKALKRVSPSADPAAAQQQQQQQQQQQHGPKDQPYLSLRFRCENVEWDMLHDAPKPFARILLGGFLCNAHMFPSGRFEFDMAWKTLGWEGIRNWTPGDLAVRIVARQRPPVGHITTYEHLEVNLGPLEAHLTTDIARMLEAYFFPAPASESATVLQGTDPAASAASGADAPSGREAAVSPKEAFPSDAKEFPATTPLSRSRSNSLNALSSAATAAIAAAPATTGPPASTAPAPGHHGKATKLDSLIAIMHQRAESNVSFNFFKATTGTMLFSYKGGTLNVEEQEEKGALYDFEDCPVQMEPLEYHSEVCSFKDLLSKAVSAVVKYKMSHLLSSGRGGSAAEQPPPERIIPRGIPSARTEELLREFPATPSPPTVTPPAPGPQPPPPTASVGLSLDQLMEAGAAGADVSGAAGDQTDAEEERKRLLLLGPKGKGKK